MEKKKRKKLEWHIHQKLHDGDLHEALSNLEKTSDAFVPRFFFAFFLMAASVITPYNNAFALQPQLCKSFNSNVITAGGFSVLTIKLINSNFANAVTSAPLIDTLPVGLFTVGSPSSDCGTVTNTATTITLNPGAVIPGSGSCTITQQVTAPAANNYLNTLGSGALATLNFGTNADPVSVTLTVNPAVPTNSITVGKAFTNPCLNPGDQTTLIFTVSNNSAVTANNVAFSETLPAGLFSLNDGTSDCGGIVDGGISLVTFSGGTIPAGSQCHISVTVFADPSHNYTNTVLANTVTASLATDIATPVSNAAPASATLTAITPEVRPLVQKVFVPDQVQCGYSILVITLSNPTDSTATITSFRDRLPAGLLPRGVAPTTTCGGPVVVQNNTIILQSGSIPTGGSCEIDLQVISRCNGTFTNRIFPGALKTSVGNNLNTARASVTFCCLRSENGLSEEGLGECLSQETNDDDEMSLYEGQ